MGSKRLHSNLSASAPAKLSDEAVVSFVRFNFILIKTIMNCCRMMGVALLKIHMLSASINISIVRESYHRTYLWMCS